MERLKTANLKAGIVKSSWKPLVTHPSIPAEEREARAASIVADITLMIRAGGLAVSDEWNRLLPDYRFTEPRKFLFDVWSGKP